MRFAKGDIVRLSLPTIPDDPWDYFVGIVAAAYMSSHFVVNTVPAANGQAEQVEVHWLNDTRKNSNSKIVVPQQWLERDLRLYCHAI